MTARPPRPGTGFRGRGPRPASRRYSAPLLAALLVSQLYLPLWAADYRLSDRPAEEELGLILPPPPAKDFPPEDKIFHFDQDRWNRAREAVERGREPGEPPPPAAEVLVSTAPAAPPPEEPGLAVDLPYESGLSISGRKLIALKLQETRRKSAKRAAEQGLPKIQRDFEMKQELQVRIKGKVGRKITVNVDFDDTKEDKRDISVVYQGDPEEIVQEAAFGDIVLSLPSTEFVSYSKQLFGVRTRLKYKRAQLMAIGSRTKGITETKRFNGNTQFERKEISDTAYIRRQYYLLAFDGSHLPLAVGSEQVWLDDRNPANNNSNTQAFTAEDFAVASSSFTGNFDLLKPGQDYTLDYARGIIRFRNTLAANAVVAVDYTLANGSRLSSLGTSGRFKILKTDNDLPIASAAESGYGRELKTFYNIGRNKIVRDNGRGNFILRTIDLNRNDTGVPLTNGSVLAYAPTGGNVEVDFEAGTFNIAPPLRASDTTLYNPDPTHKFTFLLEYRYRLKTYLVKPNIVLGSERVLVDGRLLTRDVDYFIDYDSGFLTFFNEEEINESTQIEVNYEFAPFGGQLGQTLVGTRGEFGIVPDKLFVGSTMLYTFAPKPTVVPDVRSTPNSLLVLEADSHADNIKIPFTPMTMSLAGEVAQSHENPNLFGKALVDSMEGIKQEEQAVMNHDFWQIAANPTGGNVTRPSSLAVSDEEVGLDTIQRSDRVRKGETQRVLDIDYSLANKPGTASSPEQSSIVQSISKSGRDFSKKLFMELWVQGAGAAGDGMDLIVDAGQFNEDADGDGALDTEDLNNDGTLNQGEDAGWRYDDPGPDTARGTADDILSRVGTNNARLDTEDLDVDGTKHFTDTTVRAFPLFKLSSIATTPDVKMVDPITGASDPRSDLNFTGWRFIQVPLNIGATEEPNFQAVKQVRVTLQGAPNGTLRQGRIRLGKISFSGNLWERPTAVLGSTMTVSAINNLDNPEYQTLLGNPSYNDLYKDDTDSRLKEQALSMSFILPSASTATTRSIYPSPRDFSRHKAFRFFVQSPAGRPVGETLLVQLGSETDYFEYAIPITSRYSGGWVLEEINMADLNDDGTPDILVPLNPAAAVRIVGAPKLTSVGQIKVGVRNETGAPITSEIWINEIHLSGSREKIGNARRVAADFNLPGWTNFGGKFRDVDRNFQTLTAQITNQDRLDRSGYLNFSRLRMLPLSFNISQSETITPAALRTGESGLVSVLEEGRVNSVQGSGRGELVIPSLPRLGFGYDKSITNSRLLERTDDKDSYNGSLDYSTPFRPDLLPGRFLTFRPLPETISVSYRRTNYFLSFYPEKELREISVATATAADVRSSLFSNVRTAEFTDDWSGRMSLAPWDGLSINPNYSFKRVKEQRRFSETDLTLAPDFRAAKDYDKALSQTLGLSASWRLLRWLEPRLSYTLSGTETNNLPTASSPTAFNLKAIDRTSDGEASWTFNARELLPNFHPVQSLSINNSFRVENGDTYENVARSFTAWRRLDLLQLQRVQRKNGRTIYGLLSPLDLPNPEARRKQLTVRDTLRSSTNWSPLDWLDPPRALQPVKTFNLTATVTNTDEHTETTDTVRDAVTRTWPDFILSLRDTEKFFWLQRWMGNSQANYRYNRKKTEVFNTQFTENRNFGTDYRFTLWQDYDFFLTYARSRSLDIDLRTHLLNATGKGYSHSSQVGMKFGPWRFTPSLAFKTDSARDGTGKTTQDLTVFTYSIKTRFDQSYPEGFRFPFSKRVFGKINRFTADANTTYEHKKSSLNFETANTDTYSFDVTGEWEISRNFRLSFGMGSSYIKNRAKKEDSLISYQMNSSLVIQF